MAETNGLLNRQTGLYLSRGFESRPLRFAAFPSWRRGFSMFATDMFPGIRGRASPSHGTAMCRAIANDCRGPRCRRSLPVAVLPHGTGSMLGVGPATLDYNCLCS